MSKLTPQEKRVFALLSKGLTQRQVAYQMKLSSYTVYGYTRSVRRKTGLTTFTIAAKMANETG